MTDIQPTAEQIIRDYHTAFRNYKERWAEEVEKLGDISAKDVRDAKAALNMPKELADALMEASIAREALAQADAERWIVAHEDLAVLRRSGAVN